VETTYELVTLVFDTAQANIDYDSYAAQTIGDAVWRAGQHVYEGVNSFSDVQIKRAEVGRYPQPDGIYYDPETDTYTNDANSLPSRCVKGRRRRRTVKSQCMAPEAEYQAQHTILMVLIMDDPLATVFDDTRDDTLIIGLLADQICNELDRSPPFDSAANCHLTIKAKQPNNNTRRPGGLTRGGGRRGRKANSP
jgi:hypothetical protein